MTWFGWVVAGLAMLWAGCFAIALPVFLVVDTRNNWVHGNTGLFGYVHTLARVPPLALIAPAYLGLVVGQALGFWRE